MEINVPNGEYYNIPLNEVRSLLDIKSYCQRIAFLIRNDAVLTGFIRVTAKLNNDRMIYGVETDNQVFGGTNGTFNDIILFECDPEHGILIDQSTNFLELDEKSDFVNSKNEDIIEESGKFLVGDCVSVNAKNECMNGVIIKFGRINKIFCCAVRLDEEYDSNYSEREYIVLANNISEFPGKYVFPRYKIPCGDGNGIQGNLNSCYLDTSLFAIFTFNMFLDNMLLDENSDVDIKKLQSILREEIVYPLRRTGYVKYTAISKFRDKLQSLSPDGKFVMNERDPEEFLEQLFKLLTPKKYILRTKPLSDMKNEQKCFLTQIFYDSIPENKKINLLQMFTLTFLEFEMLISHPPRCLIIQLPRDGRELKKFKKVSIPNKLDITPFIISCAKTCKDCSTSGYNLFFCKKCSLKDIKMVYYCKEHKLNCKHEKNEIPTDSKEYKGSVVLDLVSILCIERTHYITFVKTNELNGNWIYFNSMEKMDNGKFIPNTRTTNLNEYFNKGNESYFEDDIDVDKVENYAFVCVYKFPEMEFYGTDFNSY